MRSGGPSLSSDSTPRLTQSVGVPSTAYQRSSTFCMRSGRDRVRAWPVALCSRSGATTTTSARVDSALASSLIPSEKMPSSLVIRMRVIRVSFGFDALPDDRLERLDGRRRDHRRFGDQRVLEGLGAQAAAGMGLPDAAHHLADDVLRHLDVLAD